jgi:DMSO/TMAO reductase YedYZ molybdopterin-dependent catalytic subunit
VPNRRAVIQGILGLGVAAGTRVLLPGMAWGGERLRDAHADGSVGGSGLLEALPGKWPLIRRTRRPPNFETPLSYFKDWLTPNRAFYVRYHGAVIPEIDGQEWRLRIGGPSVQRPVEFTREDLRRDFEWVEVVAVNQCSGNRRGLFEPRVPGVQWGYGAMGNARWRGVRLGDLLRRAGLGKNAVEVVFQGADSPVLPGTPDFVKSLPLPKALHEDTLVALEMNGQPLPHWHGAPARLVVPGWTATYWMKHLTAIEVVAQPCDSFWMQTAYRIPKGAFPAGERFDSQDTGVTSPITEILINSVITNLEDGAHFSFGQPIEVTGIAWDGGHGIREVAVSLDEGRSWRPAELEPDRGRYAFRPWVYRFTPGTKGGHSLWAKARSRSGETQGLTLIANPAGYHHNRVQRLGIVVG